MRRVWPAEGDARAGARRAAQEDAAELADAELADADLADADLADAHLAAARDLLKSGQLEAAAERARDADLTGPCGWRGRAAAARLLLRLGAFVDADRAFRAALRDAPASADARRGLAALAHRRGDKAQAKALMVEAARLQPVASPRPRRDGAPRILMIDTIDKVAPRLARSKGRPLWRVRMAGGHFKAKDLLRRDDYEIHKVTLCSEAPVPVGALPEVDAIINTIACADLCPNALRQAHELLQGAPAPVINPPAKVLETTRRRNYERLRGLAGVLSPRIERIAPGPTPQAMALRLRALAMAPPYILRVAGTQTGRSVALIQDLDHEARYLAAAPPSAALYAIEYAPCRDPMGFFRKTRVFFIDGRLYPVAHLANDVWQIHSGDRYRVMSENAALQAQERAFLADPEAALGAPALAALERIGATLDLDFCGVDFFAGPDGVVVFEANPAMRHNFDHADAFPYTRPYLETISNAFDAMVRARAGAPAA